jgi:hypothetical protein
METVSGRKFTPVNTVPGWALRKKFVDSCGNVFEKGVFTGNENGGGYVEGVQPVTEDDIKREAMTMDDIARLISAVREENIELRKKVEEMEGKGLIPKVSNSDMAEEISRGIVRAQNETSGKVLFADTKDIDKDDFMDKPVVFSSYGVYYIITDSRLDNGQVIRTPYGTPIEFKFSHNKISKIGKDEMTQVNYCQFKCVSKKEADFLRKHPSYGIEFFESKSSVGFDVNMRVIQIATQESDRLRVIDNQRHIIDMGKEINRVEGREVIPSGVPLHEMIPHIAIYNAKKRFESELRMAEEKAKGAIYESMFPVTPPSRV